MNKIYKLQLQVPQNLWTYVQPSLALSLISRQDLVCWVSGHKLCTSLPDSWQSLSRFLAVTFSQSLLVLLVVQWKEIKRNPYSIYVCLKRIRCTILDYPLKSRKSESWQTTKYTFDSYSMILDVENSLIISRDLGN